MAFRIKVWLICWSTIRVETGEVVKLTLVKSTSSNTGVGVRRSIPAGLERTKKIWRKREIFFSVCCYPIYHKSIPLDYFHHQNVKPYPITLPIPLLLNVQNNSLHPSVSSLTKDVFWNDHYLLDCPSISTLNLGYIINRDIFIKNYFRFCRAMHLIIPLAMECVHMLFGLKICLCFFCLFGKWCSSIINQ